MSLPKVVADAIQYISSAVVRIFSPTDDDYPMSGVNPYEGVPNKKRHLND
jgi:hypothetical protein